ncbi:glycoside hydrolase family 3 protein [Streptomyces coeruleoprunus]
MHHGTSRRTLLTASAALAAAAAAGGVIARSATAEEPEAELRKLISRMSLEEKVGQLFVMWVHGHSAATPDKADMDTNVQKIGVRNAAELVAKYHVGGIVYSRWARNIRDPHQVAELSNGIQRAGLAKSNPVPVLISVDQEHGKVARIGKPATLMPGAMALGAGASTADAREAARISGLELAAMGIKQNYAPVADVSVDPANSALGVRSFGADPKAVGSLVAAQVEGYRLGGVAATPKHFPGHGGTALDSHLGLPRITYTARQWEELDAPPFRAAIDAGAESIMTAHIVVPALDGRETPATLSQPMITGILRERLGFDGVVVTDAINMVSVREKYGEDGAAVLALKAGCDQLLGPASLEVSWNGVLNAVRRGEISEQRIDESILRILRLKSRLGLFSHPYVSREGVDRVVGKAAHLAAADRIAERTTTLLTNEGRLLPLNPAARPDVLVVGADPDAPSGTGGPPTAVLANALTGLRFRARALSTGTDPTRGQIDAAVARARGKDAVIVAAYNVTGPQRTLVAELAATGVPVIVVAMNNPNDIAGLRGQRASLATYSWTDVELRAAAKVIAGAVRPRGALPVPVKRPDNPAQMLYPIGHSLKY